MDLGSSHGNTGLWETKKNPNLTHQTEAGWLASALSMFVVCLVCSQKHLDKNDSALSLSNPCQRYTALITAFWGFVCLH